MRSVLLSLLILPTVCLADFASTTTKLMINRQSIHDSKPIIVAKSKVLAVRYDPKNYSHCFIVTPSADISCTMKEGIIGIGTPHGTIYPLEMELSINDFMVLASDLKWSKEEYKSEFLALTQSYGYPITFDFSDYDYDKNIPGGTLEMRSLDVTTADGKVIYTAK